MVFSGSESSVSIRPVSIAYRGKEDGGSICGEPWRAMVAGLLHSGKRETTDLNDGGSNSASVMTHHALASTVSLQPSLAKHVRVRNRSILYHRSNNVVPARMAHILERYSRDMCQIRTGLGDLIGAKWPLRTALVMAVTTRGPLNLERSRALTLNRLPFTMRLPHIIVSTRPTLDHRHPRAW